MTGRFFGPFLACSLVVGGGASAGFAEGQPAERDMAVGVLPLAAGARSLSEPPPTANSLREAGVERAAPPAAVGTLPVASPASVADRDVPVSSPALAGSPERGDTLERAGELSGTRSKP